MKKIKEIESKENFEKMSRMTNYIMNLNELTAEILEDVQGIEEDGFYCPLTEEAIQKVPMEERWHVKYYITYHMSTLLLKYYLQGHEEMYEQLVRTMQVCLSKQYIGHGYDDLSMQLHYLIKLYENGLNGFICSEEHSEMDRQFTSIIHEYRKKLASGNTKDGWGDLKEAIMRLLTYVDKDVLFVYGTLMDGERNGFYLDDCPIYGQGVVHGYQLFQLDGYPGMVVGNQDVVGELYHINDEVKRKIDVLESSQYKYSRDIVYMSDTCYYANFYEFLPVEDKRYTLAICVNHRWLDVSNYVWYACYGSNLLDERFHQYIEYTTLKADPVASKAIMLPYELYFAQHSRRWNHGGVAFIDTDKKGMTYGWMYLITKEQFDEIQQMEGTWYQKKVTVSKDDLGIEIVTFTSFERYKEVEPSKKYLDAIRRGLKEKYHLFDSEIEEYLK